MPRYVCSSFLLQPALLSASLFIVSPGSASGGLIPPEFGFAIEGLPAGPGGIVAGGRWLVASSRLWALQAATSHQPLATSHCFLRRLFPLQCKPWESFIF